ncbi:MAG: cyclic-di-AMP receptor [Defluviitaleaceae bacterium]|nr:cyclic-di-AMP receptor [Defluviitaleaceae bacterium]
MKMIMAIVHDEDAFHILDLLIEKGIGVTKLASTGGFLKAGFTTLISGVDEDRVQEVISVIEQKCKSRKYVTSVNSAHMNMRDGYAPHPVEITIGGATIFVLNVEEFKKV